MDGADRIRADLTAVRRRRSTALTLYLGVLVLLVVGLLLAPPHPEAMPRSLSWMLTLAGVLLSAVLATSAALGVPLWRERTLFVLTSLAGLGLGGALAVIVDWRAPVTMGARCLAYGAFVSAVAMIALGALAGRVWRRFPDPGWLLAISTATVGVTALHFSCPATDAVHVYFFHLGPVLLAYALARIASRTREALLREPDL
jgi:hypothetical protein